MCHREGESLRVEDPAAAIQRFARGCALDHGQSCAAWGRALRRARAPAEDGADPREAFDRGCQLNAPSACAALGVYVLRGEPGAPDPARAHTLFSDACDDGVAEACRNLGLLLEHPDDPHDAVAAVQAVEHGCELSDPASCVQLGHYRYTGFGTARDLPGALAAYRRGCASKFELACRSVENLAFEVEDAGGPWTRGMVVEKDGARVVVQLQGTKPVPVGGTVTIHEWAIRNEVRDWVKVGDVKIRSLDEDRQAVLWIQSLEPGVRTEDYYPLLPKAGVRLEWEAAPSS